VELRYALQSFPAETCHLAGKILTAKLPTSWRDNRTRNAVAVFPRTAVHSRVLHTMGKAMMALNGWRNGIACIRTKPHRGVSKVPTIQYSTVLYIYLRSYICACRIIICMAYANTMLFPAGEARLWLLWDRASYTFVKGLTGAHIRLICAKVLEQAFFGAWLRDAPTANMAHSFGYD
jgi:hypothetical protein